MVRVSFEETCFFWVGGLNSLKNLILEHRFSAIRDPDGKALTSADPSVVTLAGWAEPSFLLLSKSKKQEGFSQQPNKNKIFL